MIAAGDSKLAMRFDSRRPLRASLLVYGLFLLLVDV